MNSHQKSEIDNLQRNLKLSKEEAIAYLEEKIAKPNYRQENALSRQTGSPRPKRSETRKHPIRHYRQIIEYIKHSEGDDYGYKND